jgi:hypothetical protein
MGLMAWLAAASVPVLAVELPQASVSPATAWRVVVWLALAMRFHPLSHHQNLALSMRLVPVCSSKRCQQLERLHQVVASGQELGRCRQLCVVASFRLRCCQVAGQRPR